MIRTARDLAQRLGGECCIPDEVITPRLRLRLHSHRRGIRVTGTLDGEPVDHPTHPLIARDVEALAVLLRARLRRPA